MRPLAPGVWRVFHYRPAELRCTETPTEALDCTIVLQRFPELMPLIKVHKVQPPTPGSYRRPPPPLWRLPSTDSSPFLARQYLVDRPKSDSRQRERRIGGSCRHVFHVITVDTLPQPLSLGKCQHRANQETGHLVAKSDVHLSRVRNRGDWMSLLLRGRGVELPSEVVLASE